MQLVPYQNTIEHVSHVSGRGYWSGRAVSLTFLPSEPNSGIRFRRVDLPGKPIVSAHVEHRRDTQLRTTLVQSGAHVEMVEHVLAALYALQIDNCIVECDAPEMPGMDGSALSFAIALERSGLRRQLAPAKMVSICAPIRIGDESNYLLAIPSRDPGLTIRYVLDYGPTSSVPKCESTLLVDRETFTTEIAPARTFLEEKDAKGLQSRGVATHVTYRDLIIFGDHGPIENSLRYQDECSRHKLLDVIGDLSLCQHRIQGKIIAHRSGHNLNGRLAQELFELTDKQQMRKAG
ncbi:MAG: UDP-3-O-acyl-N-acetylglucosamine deacetylase [Pirellula sp.]|jgi:UDP-3-O-acyl N-acetylglucosamine deacetylase|nr:UDP-3-O-acyl-N-acetylglucosamine deacetylase [Pirellula sp.]